MAEQTSRSAAILAAVRRELDQRRQYLDTATDVGAVTVTVKLNAGTTWIRSITWTEERVGIRQG